MSPQRNNFQFVGIPWYSKSEVNPSFKYTNIDTVNAKHLFGGAFSVVQSGRFMSLFQTVKDNVTTRQAAERYGVKVNHSGMCRCPFHNDRNPSMKLYEKAFIALGARRTVM